MAARDLKKLGKGKKNKYTTVPPHSANPLLNLTKNDIDLIFDMLAIDDAVVQPFLKLLNAPNQNLRRAHIAALRVKLDQVLQSRPQ